MKNIVVNWPGQGKKLWSTRKCPGYIKHNTLVVVGSGPRRAGRRGRPRAGRDSGPDQDRYGAHSNADSASGDAGAIAREQDP